MTYDLSGITAFLQQAVHPEIHHFRNGSHPGPGWWLKTVCPDPAIPRVDGLGFGRSWQDFADRHPGLVRVVPVAFNWSGDIIAETFSVWVADDRDITVTQVGDGLTFREAVKAETDLEAAATLATLAEAQRDEAAGLAAQALERGRRHAALRSQFVVIQNREEPDGGD